MYERLNRSKIRKRHNLLFKLITVIIILTVIFIISWYAIIGTILYQTIEDPSEVGMWIGKLLNGVKEQIK